MATNPKVHGIVILNSSQAVVQSTYTDPAPNEEEKKSENQMKSAKKYETKLINNIPNFTENARSTIRNLDPQVHSHSYSLLILFSIERSL